MAWLASRTKILRRGSEINENSLRKKYSTLLPALTEKQRRLVVAADVETLKISITDAARLSGLARGTIGRGLREIKSGEVGGPGSSRRKGGGRKPIAAEQPGIVKQLEKLIEPGTRGDPMSLLRWTLKSTRNLAKTLSASGFRISHNAVADLLHVLKFSLKGNSKQIEGSNHRDRDRQFRFINRLAKKFLGSRNPVISVDTKKKELVGEYKNVGREWSPKGEPTPVLVHDFIDPATPKAIPYGIYDMTHNEGFVNVGINHDTAEFAVQSIRAWYRRVCRRLYPKAKKLFICADAGGSNGPKLRLWKVELQRLANETGLEISVSHYPPGTSKWNKIEHRLFSFISVNWRAKPLLSYQVIVDLIASTKTSSGLKVTARLDRRKYEKGRTVSDEDLAAVRLRRSTFHGDWNYTICPNY